MEGHAAPGMPGAGSGDAMILQGVQNEVISVLTLALLLAAIAGLSAVVAAVYLRLARPGSPAGGLRFEQGTSGPQAGDRGGAIRPRQTPAPRDPHRR
jgi:hypothetical protein